MDSAPMLLAAAQQGTAASGPSNQLHTATCERLPATTAIDATGSDQHWQGQQECPAQPNGSPAPAFRSATYTGLLQAAAAAGNSSAQAPDDALQPFSSLQPKSFVLAPTDPAGYREAALAPAQAVAAPVEKHQQQQRRSVGLLSVLGADSFEGVSTDGVSSGEQGAGQASCAARPAQAAGSAEFGAGSQPGDRHRISTGHNSMDATDWTRSAHTNQQQLQETRMPPSTAHLSTHKSHTTDPGALHAQLAAATAAPAALQDTGVFASLVRSLPPALQYQLLLSLMVPPSTSVARSGSMVLGHTSSAAASQPGLPDLLRIPATSAMAAAASLLASAAQQEQPHMQIPQDPCQHMGAAVSAPTAARAPPAPATAPGALMTAPSPHKAAPSGTAAGMPVRTATLPGAKPPAGPAAGLMRPRAAPVAAATGAGVMKRKASSSIPSSPAALSPRHSDAGAPPLADAASTARALLTQLLASIRAPLATSAPGNMSSSGYGQRAIPAGAAPAACAAPVGTAGMSAGTSRVGASGASAACMGSASAQGLPEPRGWMATAGPGAGGSRGFRTAAHDGPEAEDPTCSHILQQSGATPACRTVGAAGACAERGWGDGSTEDDVDVVVSPSMAAAAAAMADLSHLFYDSTACNPPAAAEAGQTGASTAARSRKAMRQDAAAARGEGTSGGGVGAWQHCQEQHWQQSGSSSRAVAATAGYNTQQDPTQAEAAAAAAAMAAVASAGMTAGSMGWNQLWHGGNSHNGVSSGPAAAATMPGAHDVLPFGYPAPAMGTAAITAGAARGDTGGGFNFKGLNWSAPEQQGMGGMGGFPMGMMMGWPGMMGYLGDLTAQQEAGQQHTGSGRARGRGRGRAGSAKPRKPPSKREPWEGTDDDEEEAGDHRKGARAAAAARRGRAAAKSRTAGRGGGGGVVGGSTSSYRGVGQHCHTLRWESHLWDGDMARSATPGTPRTKGKQTYLGGYNTEAEAARAYDRAALVYWGEKGNTNFPKSDYAAEMPLLTALTRQEVVANLRSISHTTRTSVPPKHEGVYPHQALTGMWEARLYGAPAAGRPKGAYQLLGAFLTEEAACEALAQATLAMQLEIAAAPADAVVRVAAAASKVPTSAAAAEETPPHALPAQQQQHKLADNAADTGGDPSGRPSCPTQSDGSPANAAAATVEAAATPLFVSEAQLDEAWQVAMRAINGAANFGASGTPTAGI